MSTPECHRCEELRRVVETQQARLDGRRQCLTCGRHAPAGVDRTYIDPACVSAEHEGYAACLFNATPDEAWQYWSQKAHEASEEVRTLHEALATERHHSDRYAKEVARLRQAISNVTTWAYAGGDAEPFFWLQEHLMQVLHTSTPCPHGEPRPERCQTCSPPW